MGLGSGQQHFGKSNKTVLILMPDNLFTSQFESIFPCKSKGTVYSMEWSVRTESWSGVLEY